MLISIRAPLFNPRVGTAHHFLFAFRQRLILARRKLLRSKHEHVQMRSLASIMVISHGARQGVADVASLGDVAGFTKTEGEHELVHCLGGKVHGKFFLLEIGIRRAGGEAVIGNGGDDDVVRERVGGVAGPEDVEHRNKFQEGAGPAVHEDDGDGVGPGREKGGEV